MLFVRLELRHDRASRLPPAPAPPAAAGAEPRDCARLKSKADHAA
jgi:hypothetical protein